MFKVKQGFETKECVKRFSANREVNSYVSLLNTFGCAQSEALWVKENVLIDVKTQGIHCREQQLPYGDDLNVHCLCN